MGSPGTEHPDVNAEHAAVFAAFADPTRLKLVKILAHQEIPGAMCVNALANALGVSQSAVSQHLRILKNIGLVTSQRQGYRIHYAINSEAMEHCHDIILAALSTEHPGFNIEHPCNERDA